MYKFIHDWSEVYKFYEDIVPPLKDGEVYFCSLSCRQKWMKDLGITAVRKGSSEMFERKIIRETDWNKFIRTFRKYEANDGAYTFDDGSPMPNEGMGIYWNINPSNMVKATSEFAQKMIRSLAEVSLGQGSSMDYIKHLDREIMSCLHHATGSRHYIDIDVDMAKGKKFTVEGHAGLSRVLEDLKGRGVEFALIDTRSGYHILMKRESIKFDYTGYLKTVLDSNREVFDDLMTNHNRMIPLPGALQGGYPVRIIYDLSNFEGALYD